MPQISRRTLLGSIAAAAAFERMDAAATSASVAAAETIARDEFFWQKVAAQFDLPAGIVQLENGNWGVMARPVLKAYERALERVNRDSSFYVRRTFGSDIAKIRHRVAATLGVGDDEIAFTRNATEALQALIGGYNRLKPGDRILYADLDYDSMQHAMDWLKVRRGVDVVRIAIPEPATYENIVGAYETALRADGKIRLILLTHISHRTGLMIPVKEITAVARRHGVDTIVDAAHSWGQVNLKVSDLGADFIGFNLHKWIGAPLGCGLVYIRRERIADIDPFMAGAEAANEGILSRVHTGTVNYAAFLTIPEALDFHDAVGPDNKEARLRYLRTLWTEPLRGRTGIDILTPADPRLNAGMATFRLKGRISSEANAATAEELLTHYGIFCVHRTGVAQGACVRVTPAVFNSTDDMMRLRTALEAIRLA